MSESSAEFAVEGCGWAIFDLLPVLECKISNAPRNWYVNWYRKSTTNNNFIWKGCFCDNWKPNFLPRLVFNWRIFSRRVTALWWRQQKFKCRPIRTQEIGGVRLSEELHVKNKIFFWYFKTMELRRTHFPLQCLPNLVKYGWKFLNALLNVCLSAYNYR